MADRKKLRSKASRMKVKRELEAIRHASREDEEFHPVLKLAAVLTEFDAFEVAETYESDPEAAFMQLVEHSDLTSVSSSTWVLPLEKRQDVMAQFRDRDEVLAQLESPLVRGNDPLQGAFATLMKGPKAVSQAIDRADETTLNLMMQTMDWLSSADHLTADLPGKTELHQALSKARRVAPLNHLVGDFFQGREDVLKKMETYLEGPDNTDVLFLHGPGGIGKSTVLAKFALTARTREDVDAIAYLNLDRPLLVPQEPLSLVIELLVQLTEQFPEYSSDLGDVSQRVASFMHRLALYEQSKSSLEAISEGATSWESVISDVGQTLSRLPGDQSILILLDTFEQAQRYGDVIVSELWRMSHLLMLGCPRLRIIAAGRLEDHHYSKNRIGLEAFEYSDVERILDNAVQESVPPDLTELVFDETRGHPLTVKLAASLIKRIGVKSLADPAARKRMVTELRNQSRDAVLYNRILEQIPDKRIQKIAVPGLVMRRITAAAIREVLADPCDLELETDGAQELFELMASEVDLVSREVGADGIPALVHRADVRSLMLEKLRSSRFAQAAEIDRRAIAHFAKFDTIEARAEEIYHRIWRGDDDEALEARWNSDDLRQHLFHAVDELPVTQQLWLSRKLGVQLSDAANKALSLTDWEEEATSIARRLLARGDSEGALRTIRARPDRRLGSALFALEAEALVASGAPEDALAVLEDGVVSIKKANAQLEFVELLLISSQIKEGLRHFADAARDATEAFEVSEAIGNTEFQLRAAAGLLRLHRKTRNLEHPNKQELILGVDNLIHLSQTQDGNLPLPDLLMSNPSLTRELAAEIGDEYPELLVLAAEQSRDLSVSEDDDIGVAVSNAVQDKLLRLSERMGYGIEPGSFTARDGLSNIISIARNQGILGKVAKPLSWLLATQIDRLIGAFPSKSMIERIMGLKIDDD